VFGLLLWSFGSGQIFLVEKGADIHAIYDRASLRACLYDHLEVAKFLVDKGANIHANPNTYQYLVKHGIIKN